jgi:hypothetical protein
MKADLVKLGDVLELERVPVEVDPDAEYRQIGIRSFGNGIFHREPCSGNELSKLSYFEVSPDRLVVSNIMAWEGAIAVSTESERGFVGSARFLSYRATGDVDIRYLNYYFQSPAGRSLIRSASTGTVTRNQTLSPRSFERSVVPLPGLDEQRRIADKLSITLAQNKAAASASAVRAKLVYSLIDALAAKVFDDGASSGWQLKALGDLAEVAPRTKRPDAGEEVAFVPMAALSEVTGSIAGQTYKDAAEVGGGYAAFRRGDVIFARITPCMQNGKSAIFVDDRCEYGFGSTEFHVIRPPSALDGQWVHRFLRTRRFRDSAVRHMTGTAGQQRVPASYLRQVQIPVPCTVEEQERSLRIVDGLAARRLRFRALHLSQQENLKSLNHSLLNAAFTGQL